MHLEQGHKAPSGGGGTRQIRCWSLPVGPCKFLRRVHHGEMRSQHRWWLRPSSKLTLPWGGCTRCHHSSLVHSSWWNWHWESGCSHRLPPGLEKCHRTWSWRPTLTWCNISLGKLSSTLLCARCHGKSCPWTLSGLPCATSCSELGLDGGMHCEKTPAWLGSLCRLWWSQLSESPPLLSRKMKNPARDRLLEKQGWGLQYLHWIWPLWPQILCPFLINYLAGP